MKKLNQSEMESVQGGRGYSNVLTINGQKLVLQAVCNNGGNSFFNGNGPLFGSNGNGASVLHLAGVLGGISAFAIFNAIFVVDCRGNGSPNVSVFIF